MQCWLFCSWQLALEQSLFFLFVFSFWQISCGCCLYWFFIPIFDGYLLNQVGLPNISQI
jgi:hypothetical protein